MFISNKRFSFHLWWKKNLARHQKVSKYYHHDCRIERATFSYKTALSEDNFKVNVMESIEWTYHKERSFAVTALVFRKFYFSFRTSYKELMWCTNHSNIHIHTFRKRWSLILRCLFPVNIVNVLVWTASFPYVVLPSHLSSVV